MEMVEVGSVKFETTAFSATFIGTGLAEIRTNILKVLYYFAKNNPRCMMDRSEVKSKVGIKDDKIVDFNMFYLEDKGFVKLTKYIGVAWAFAHITNAGIDFVESL